MLKVLNSSEIRKIDKYTIVNEPILSVDLMKRAVLKLLQTIKIKFPDQHKFILFSGPGNNGGDTVALFRLLIMERYSAVLYLVHNGVSVSHDCAINIKRLNDQNLPYSVVHSITDIIPFDIGSVIIDGIFGSGLSRQTDGLFSDVIAFINSSSNTVISIDIPSGLFDADNNLNNGAIIHANYTLTLQIPKLAFFFSENEIYVGEWILVDIGLHPKAIRNAETNIALIQRSDIAKMRKPRSYFSYKGNFGHALIVAGNMGKYGAAVLVSKACLRAGAGLVSMLGNGKLDLIMHCSVPEIMMVTTKDIHSQSNLKKYSVFAIGPGMGLNNDAEILVEEIVENYDCPMVFDADAISILSKRKELLKKIPFGSVLTPHVGEFDRLAGESSNSLERLNKAIRFCIEYKVIIVLKGANSAIIDTNGFVFYSITGNPGMSTAGSGDVLTGIIAGLLSSGYTAVEAAQMGVWLHGMAADCALIKQTVETLIASDIIDNLANAIKALD